MCFYTGLRFAVHGAVHGILGGDLGWPSFCGGNNPRLAPEFPGLPGKRFREPIKGELSRAGDRRRRNQGR